MLIACEWFAPLTGITIRDLAKTAMLNATRQEACYYLNDNKVRFLENLRKNNAK